MAMELTLHSSQETLLVRSVSDHSISVGTQEYLQSLILLPESLHTDWDIVASAQLTRESAESLLAHQPELVILGTGTRLVFPRQAFNYALLSQGIGCEVMDTRAACRTYNVLASEGRRVLGAFILEDLDPAI